MDSKKVGIIGYGVVGRAVENTLSKVYEVLKYDKFGDYDGLETLLQCDLIFIAVPTPFVPENERIDLSAVEDSLIFLEGKSYGGTVIIKSTLPVGSCKSFLDKYNLSTVYNPEFLRESKTPFKDFEDQNIVVIGTDDKPLFNLVKSFYQRVLNASAQYFHVSPTEGEMIKYSQNATLASRVAIANVMFDACQHYGLDYDLIRKLAFDECDLLGPNMVEVPGPDGKRGFGGKCLPKDTLGFDSIYPSSVLSSIINYNETLREDFKVSNKKE